MVSINKAPVIRYFEEGYAVGTKTGVLNGKVLYVSVIPKFNVTITKIFVNCPTVSSNGRAALYSGAPTTLLSESGSQALVAGGNFFTLATPQALTAGTVYWVALQLGAASDYVYTFSVTSGYVFYESLAYGAFPATATPVAYTVQIRAGILS